MTYNPNIHSVLDCISQDGTIISEDCDGNPLPDDDWQCLDSGDNVILRGRDEIEAETGIVDYDGEYDKYIIKDIEDCTDEEIECLYKEYEDGISLRSEEEICDYVCERKGLHRIHNIKFYKSNADVFISNDDPNSGCSCIHFSWDGFDNDEDVMNAWETFFEERDIDPVSRDEWETKCDRTYFN